MKTKLLIFLLFFSLYSCNEKPTYCETPYKVEQIRLVPVGTFRIGNEVIINNDSLISIITSQICDVKDASWSTGNRMDGKAVEIQFFPKSKKNICSRKRI